MTNINWYPGHMPKTKRKIKENLSYIDVVFELVDARIPYSSKIKEFDDLLKEKPRILIFTKYDLCDQDETNKWIKSYQKENYETISFNLLEDKVQKLKALSEKVLANKTAHRLEKGFLKRRTRVLIIGAPNVGKSTLINRLVSKKATKVANRPGVTKALAWIRIDDEMELLDTPGILSPRYSNQEIALNLAAFLAIKEDLIPLEEVVNHILKILIKYYPEVLKKRYQLTTLTDSEAILNAIGKRRGCLVKGGVVDTEKAMQVVLNDVREGYLSGITFDKKEL